jgi:hypothetical protein
MSYLKISNERPEKYSIAQFRRDNPNTSYPKTIPEEYLAEQEVYPYTVDDTPEYDSLTQFLQESFEKRNGSWYRTFTIEALDQERAENNIRNRRDGLLRETDWMALNDVSTSQDWANYRQALRDITTQTGFPYTVVWPQTPQKL